MSLLQDPHRDPFSIQGSVAIVTGSSRGIGLAIAKEYIGAGVFVTLVARDSARLEAAAETLPPDRVSTFAGNASDPEVARECVRTTIERFGRLDLLVNNAAANLHVGSMLGVDTNRFAKMLQINLLAPLSWIQAAHELAFKDHGGAIVNISSVGAFHGGSDLGVYNLTKEALIQLTRVLAHDLGPHTRINAIAPGLVRTGFSQALWETSGDQFAAQLPLQRLGEASDVAAAALFLASPSSGWMTGQTLVVDGGSSVRRLPNPTVTTSPADPAKGP